MITDRYRREVAARIRKRLRENKDRYLDVLIGKAMSTCVPHGMTYGQTVADLIDRPTCTIERKGDMNPWEEYELELSCGHAVEWPADQNIPKYCPWCGAEVVEDD